MTMHKGWFSVDVAKRAAKVRSNPLPPIINEALSNSLGAGATAIAISCKPADGNRRMERRSDLPQHRSGSPLE